MKRLRRQDQMILSRPTQRSLNSAASWSTLRAEGDFLDVAAVQEKQICSIT